MAVSGIWLAALLASMIYLLQRSGAAIEAINKTNIILESNIEEQKRAEADAQQANSEGDLEAPSEGDTLNAKPACKILYIEDNATNARLVKDIINSYTKHHLLLAKDAVEGIHIAENVRPGVILWILIYPK